MIRQRPPGRTLPPPDAARLAVFLDVDGTLLAIAPTPDAVTVPAALIDALSRARVALAGALALVSGRSIAALDALFRPLILSAVGLHGFELRLDGVAHRPPPDARLAGETAQLTAAFAGRAGIFIEDKGGTVALHFRGAPEAEAEIEAAAAGAARALGPDYHVLAGKMVREVKPRGCDKGRAVRKATAAAPFRGRCPVYFGDDATDEDAFRVVNAMGGVSVRVGNGAATAARFAVESVDDVRHWLDGLGGRAS